jgi:hypothetical protein
MRLRGIRKPVESPIGQPMQAMRHSTNKRIVSGQRRMISSSGRSSRSVLRMRLSSVRSA